MNKAWMVVVVVGVACGGSAAKPPAAPAAAATPGNSPAPCEGVAAAAGVALVDDEDGTLDAADLAAEQAAVGDAIARSCVQTAWSATTIDCVRAATELEAIAACLDEMGPAQQEDFQAANLAAGAPFEANH